MTLAVPECNDPELSAVIVTHGAWELAERAISNLVEHTARPFELIVVDNDSDRETRAELARLDNVRVLFNDENRGFGPATNQGAAEARAAFLLLLNSDALVHPGWLEPLLGALAHAGVAAAVPRYLNPDGSLQEAGALLARDGTVMPYGEGDDRELPRYRFPRTIDYGSAACMLVRRENFLERGGFDERYAPAYYEDLDFCMKLRQDGLSIVFEPRSTVTHVGQGSDVGSAAVALSERNHKLFFERWGGRLAGRPWTLVNASEQAVIGARDALATPRGLICSRPDESRIEALVGALLQGWPRARITWATDLNTDRGFDADVWLARGVELASRQDLDWLGERLFHYDLIVYDTENDSELIAAIDETQPQALRASLADVDGESGALLSDLEAVLAAAGIVRQREP